MPRVYDQWTITELNRAKQLHAAGLTYNAIAIVLWVDGYSKVKRSRHSVNSGLRKAGCQPRHINRPTEKNLKRKAA